MQSRVPRLLTGSRAAAAGGQKYFPPLHKHLPACHTKNETTAARWQPKKERCYMADRSKFTKEMQNYYDTLPAFIQESISQSSSSFNDLQSLRAFAERIKEEKRR